VLAESGFFGEFFGRYHRHILCRTPACGIYAVDPRRDCLQNRGMRTTKRTVQIRRACAQTIRSLRLKAGLSQERLARDLGIDRGNYQLNTAAVINIGERGRPATDEVHEKRRRNEKAAAALPPTRLAAARIDREAFPALNTYPPLPTQPGAFSSLESFQKTSIRQGGGSIVKEGLAGRIADRDRGGLKGGRMRHPAKVMPFAMALSVTTVMVPQAIAQAPPAAPPAQQQQTQQPTQGQQPPQQTQSQQQQSSKGSKARGAAGGAVVGAAAGNAAAGAVVGAGHSRRQDRRDNRHQQQ
jgi:transcriptional regulator with XRE-family HTH domain